MMDAMRAAIDGGEVKSIGGFDVERCDDFEYVDPVDGSVTVKQGIRFIFTDGSRIIFRLSGTGSVGATVRLYMERYVAPGGAEGSLGLQTGEALKDLVTAAAEVSKLKEFTGRDEPTVIT
jgi:phosphoglucomutase